MTEKELKVLLKAWGEYWRRVENNYPHQSSGMDMSPITMGIMGRLKPKSRVLIPDPPDDIWQLTRVMEELMKPEIAAEVRQAVSVVRVTYLTQAPIKDVADAFEMKERAIYSLLSQGYVALLVALQSVKL